MNNNFIKIVFIISTCILFCVDGESVQDESIILSAIGRVATLGDLYDATSDEFNYFNLFTETLPNSLITETRNEQCEMHYTLKDSFREKFHILDIEAGLHVSILSDMVSVAGSGEYLNSKKESARSAKASVVLSCEIANERISITHSNISSLINLDLLKEPDSTHVVVGIQWGGKVVISIEDQNQELKDQQTVQGGLELTVKKIYGVLSASGGANVNITEEEKTQMNSFSFDFYGDYTPKELPTTLVDSFDFIKEAPSEIQENNDGKGIPLQYVLIPLNKLQRLHNIIPEIKLEANQIDRFTSEKCVELFDNINLIEQRLNDFVTDLNQVEPYIKTDRVEKVLTLQSSFTSYQTELKSQLSEKLNLVRSGQETQDKLEEIIDQSITWKNVETELYQFDQLKQEISLIKLLQSKNVTFFHKEQDISKFIWDNREQIVHILYHDFSSENYSISQNEPMKEFMQIIEQYKDDENFHPIHVSVNYEIFENEFKESNETKTYWCTQGECHDSLHDGDIDRNVTIRMRSIFNNINDPVPLNFIYTQLPHQQDPKSLWPTLDWTDITSDYGGLFFRVEGEDTESFGTVQEENLPRITEIGFCDASVTKCEPQLFELSDLLELEVNSTSKFIVTGGQNRFARNLENFYYQRYYTSGGEVRPRNMAVRIWKRTG